MKKKRGEDVYKVDGFGCFSQVRKELYQVPVKMKTKQ